MIIKPTCWSSSKSQPALLCCVKAKQIITWHCVSWVIAQFRSLYCLYCCLDIISFVASSDLQLHKSTLLIASAFCCTNIEIIAVEQKWIFHCCCWQLWLLWALSSLDTFHAGRLTKSDFIFIANPIFRSHFTLCCILGDLTIRFWSIVWDEMEPILEQKQLVLIYEMLNWTTLVQCTLYILEFLLCCCAFP